MRLFRTLAAACAAVALALPAMAQTWPTRPVTMVIPFAAGGPTDVLGRIFADRMGQILGQQVIIENVTGAGGMIGSQRVAQAAPDGYTLLMGTVGTHAVNQTLYAKPLYNAATDFAPVLLMAEVPLVLIVRKDLPVSDLKTFIEYTRQNQKQMNFASAGPGSAVHLGCLLLNAAMKTDVTHVPYRGSAPAMTDMLAGRVDFMCEIVSTAMPHITSGGVKPLAMLTRGRSPVLPDLASAHEQGLTDFEAYTWNAFFFPKGTPEAIVKRMREVTIEAMETPALREALQKIGATLVDPPRRTTEYLDRFVRSEIEKWAGPIKASGVAGQ